MDDQFCGLIVLFGGILFWIFIINSNSEGVNKAREKYKDTVQAQLEKGEKAYSVTYKSGHKGIDHYLKVYLKKSELQGILTITSNYIQFECPWTRTTQKFKLDWNQIKSVTKGNDNLFAPRNLFLIQTRKYRNIRLFAK